MSSRGRAIIFAGGAVALIVLVLHFPFDGYVTDCMGLSTLNYMGFRDCLEASGAGELSPLEWRTNGALLNQLRSVKQLLVWEGLVAAITIGAIFAFDRRE